VFNLYDLTNGNYRVLRVVSYPDYPESLILFDVEVQAVESEWATTIYLNGTYNGPTDVVANKDYQVRWMIDDRKVLESGTVELELSSGKHLRQSWSSIITPVTDADERPAVFGRFPAGGELVNVSISPFEVDKNAMGYKWEGTVGQLEDDYPDLG
jgi:hypothetical protein